MRPEDMELLASLRDNLVAVRQASLQELSKHTLPPAVTDHARARILRKLTGSQRENETHGLYRYALHYLRADAARRWLILYLYAELEGWVLERLPDVIRVSARHDRRWARVALRSIEVLGRKMETAATSELGEQLFAQRFAQMQRAAHRLDRLYLTGVQHRAA